MIQEDFLPEEKVLIDGDMIAYTVSSAADGRCYQVFDGKNRPVFKNAELANEYLKQLGLSSLWRETKYYPDPIENCLHSAKLMIHSILDDCKTKTCQIFLSGVDNFRFKVYDKYKANRVDTHKPVHLKAVREYLVKYFNAVVVDGAEADDALGIWQTTESNTIIASLDKDLDMIPGKHYKWSHCNSEPEHYTISRTDAIRCFLKQLITGDTTDNIPGLSEQAPKKRAYKTAPLDSMESTKEMFQYVTDGYKLKYGEQDYKYHLDLNSKLLWIHRTALSIIENNQGGIRISIDYI